MNKGHLISPNSPPLEKDLQHRWDERADLEDGKVVKRGERGEGDFVFSLSKRRSWTVARRPRQRRFAAVKQTCGARVRAGVESQHLAGGRGGSQRGYG